MALARKYYTVNGEIISELRAGETDARDYVTDALGNVVAVFQNDWEIALATYDTSGEFLTNFNMSDSRFAWNGSHGYRSTGLEWSTHYVRARHYSFMDQAWTTVDPLRTLNHFPFVAISQSYMYSNNRPIFYVDRSGLIPCKGYDPVVASGSSPLGTGALSGDLDRCLFLPIDIPAFSIKLFGELEICRDNYDTKCCPEPVASHCVDMRLNIGGSLKIIPVDPKRLGQMTRATAQLLLGLFGGGYNMMFSNFLPLKGCPAIEKTHTFEICMRGCYWLGSFEACAGVSYPSMTYHSNLKFFGGYCGLPEIDLFVRAQEKNCI